MATLKPGSKNSVRPRGRRRIRPSLLVLENRTLLSTLVVTNLQDSGNGSLRFELSQANNNDTITFQSTLFAAGQQTITLTSGPLAVSKDVSIQGPGASLLTVSGNSTQEIFKVSSPGSPSQGSTISGMTITKGFSSTNGGAIYNSGMLALSGCTISGSKAGSFQAYYSANGGAIYNKGTLSLSGCTVSGNYSSGNGGAIDSEGGAAFAFQLHGLGQHVQRPGWRHPRCQEHAQLDWHQHHGQHELVWHRRRYLFQFCGWHRDAPGLHCLGQQVTATSLRRHLQPLRRHDHADGLHHQSE